MGVPGSRGLLRTQGHIVARHLRALHTDQSSKLPRGPRGCPATWSRFSPALQIKKAQLVLSLVVPMDQSPLEGYFGAALPHRPGPTLPTSRH